MKYMEAYITNVKLKKIDRYHLSNIKYTLGLV